MTKTFKNYWCIVHPNGNYYLDSMHPLRKWCIAIWLDSQYHTWEECKSFGWSVKKVTVTITEV